MANLEKIAGITLVLAVAMCCQTPTERADRRTRELSSMIEHMTCVTTPRGTCVCGYASLGYHAWAFVDPTGKECEDQQ